jgi:hypothetical protein
MILYNTDQLTDENRLWGGLFVALEDRLWDNYEIVLHNYDDPAKQDKENIKNFSAKITWHRNVTEVNDIVAINKVLSVLIGDFANTIQENVLPGEIICVLYKKGFRVKFGEDKFSRTDYVEVEIDLEKK